MTKSDNARKPRKRWMRALTGVAIATGVLGTAWPGNATRAAAADPGSTPSAPAAAPAAPAPGAALAMDAPNLDESHVRQVYAVAEEWVRAGKSPVDVAPLRVTGLTGVRVTVRWLGMQMGTGQVTTKAIPVNDKGSADLALATQIAVNQALAMFEKALAEQRASWEVERKKGMDPAIRGAVQSTQPAAATPDQAQGGVTAGGARAASETLSVKAVAPKLRLELQVAGPLEAIRVDDKAPAEFVTRQFVSHHHALRMTRPGAANTEAWFWPGTAISANTMPRSQLMQLLSALGYEPKDLERIAHSNGPTLQRANVIHMARSYGTESGLVSQDKFPAEVLVRGNLLVPPVPVDEAVLETLSRGYVSFLIRRMKNEVTYDDPRDKGALKPRKVTVTRMAGAYLPSAAVFDAQSAADEEIALATYALASWATYVDNTAPKAEDGSRHLSADLMELKLEAESALRNNLDPILNGAMHDGGASPVTTAYALLTLVESPRFVDRKSQRDDAARKLLGMIQPTGVISFAKSTKGAKDAKEERVVAEMPLHTMITFALSRWYHQTRDDAALPAILKASQWAWAHPQTRGNPEALMWLVNAELALRRSLKGVSGADGKPLHTGVTDAMLASGAAAFRESQIIRAPEGPGAVPSDVIGGFVVRRSVADAGPESPDWKSATFICFLSATLREPQVGESKERLATLLSAGLGVRFLKQLTFEPPSLYYIRSPEDTLGGVRVNLTDNRLPSDATALSLMAVTQLREAIEAIKAADQIK